MMIADFYALAQQCAPQVHPVTMASVMHVESGGNPYAIGVVKGHLERQPKNQQEATATAIALDAAGWNFSVGIGQVNRYNLAAYGLNYETAFDACANLKAGASILKKCYDRALPRFSDKQQALKAAFSCYYSGNFSTGFKPDFKGQPSYVQKVLASADAVVKAIPVIANPGTKPPVSKKFDAKTPAVNPQNEAAINNQIEPQQPAKKTRNVPARLDGFSNDDDKNSNQYDGYK